MTGRHRQATDRQKSQMAWAIDRCLDRATDTVVSSRVHAVQLQDRGEHG